MGLARKGKAMKAEDFKKSWDEIKGEVRRRWDRLTEEDLEQIDGDVDRLTNKLRERYDYSQEEAESAAKDLMGADGAGPAEPLRKKAQQMQTTVGKTAQDVSGRVRVTAQEVGGKMQETVGDVQVTVSKAAEDVSKELREAADEITKQMRETADDVSAQLRRAARDVSADAQSAAEIAASTLQERVVESPWASLAAAFGIGFFFGLIFRRR
jgi:uncharacterized protein YjbJ (UPF0337 family)